MTEAAANPVELPWELESRQAGAQTPGARLAERGVDLDRITEELEEEGVKASADSYEALLAAVVEKRAAFDGEQLIALDAELLGQPSGIEGYPARMGLGLSIPKVQRVGQAVQKAGGAVLYLFFESPVQLAQLAHILSELLGQSTVLYGQGIVVHCA